MSANFFAYTQRTHCSVCSEKLVRSVLDFPALPVLTGVFTKQKSEIQDLGLDQSFCFCSKCGHGQVSTVIDPEFLYNQDYSFKTSSSKTATNELEKFINFLEKIFSDRIFNKVADIGCNDLYLLKRLKNKAKSFCGVDMMQGFADNQQQLDSSVALIAKRAEDLDVSDFKGECPDLVVATHMLEHAQEPKEVLCNLMRCAAEDALFVFEVPCLEQMLQGYRFDRIFHQHLQYFSLESFKNLLSLVGAEYIDHCYNLSHWGSMTIAFKKKTNSFCGEINNPDKDLSVEIKSRYDIFRKNMSKISDEINQQEKGSVVGYGASNMLPILFYHLRLKDNLLDLVFDDDIMKNDLYFQGLGVRVKNLSQSDQLEQKTVVVTALDHVDVIAKKVLSFSVDKIVIPLQDLP